CELPSHHTPRSPRHPHPFPTRRSSDLARSTPGADARPKREHLRAQVRESDGEPGTVRATGGEPGTVRATGGGSGVMRLARLPDRSEEHTSELQSRENLVCRLLLEKKNK